MILLATNHTTFRGAIVARGMIRSVERILLIAKQSGECTNSVGIASFNRVPGGPRL